MRKVSEDMHANSSLIRGSVLTALGKVTEDEHANASLSRESVLHASLSRGSVLSFMVASQCLCGVCAPYAPKILVMQYVCLLCYTPISERV
jgi:hypothetical protein